MSSFIRKISYSKVIPRWLLRFADELLLLPAMWFPHPTVRKLFNRLRGVRIGKGGWIGQGALLGNHPFLLTIKDNVIIAAGAKLLTHDTSFTVVGGKDMASEVVIGSNVQIGENAVVLPGVSIGDSCVIGAGAVVNKDIPPQSVAAGVPARVICSITEALSKLDEKLKGGKYFSTWEYPCQATFKPSGSFTKICILSNKNHIYSNYLIRRIIELNPDCEFTVVESTRLLGGMDKLPALFKYLKVSGFRYTVSQVIKTYYFNYLGFISGFLNFNFGRKFVPYKFLKFKNLKNVVSYPDINSKLFVSWMKEHARPDLILSIFFNQILKEEILNIPRFGAFNLHPSLLPKYRGISPTFWALANGEKTTGVTLHKMNWKIDVGEILGQKEVEILPDDTEHSLYMRCCQVGLKLIISLIDSLKQGLSVSLRQMNLSEKSYYSLPKKRAVEDFFNSNKRLWSLSEFFKKYE